MPVSIHKRGNRYEVDTPNQVHAKGTTKAKAVRQARLLNAIDHGWTPTHSKARRARKSHRLT